MERTWLDRARSALARGDALGARAALAGHQREFPKGVLAEEREYLSVLCALREGRVADARERAARFRASFPSSALLPALLESMDSNP
jgi:outer membrane protein assembly factor BamD (BamD/ComL family)